MTRLWTNIICQHTTGLLHRYPSFNTRLPNMNSKTAKKRPDALLKQRSLLSKLSRNRRTLLLWLLSQSLLIKTHKLPLYSIKNYVIWLKSMESHSSLTKRELALVKVGRCGLMSIGTCKITMEAHQIWLPSEAKLASVVSIRPVTLEFLPLAQPTPKLLIWWNLLTSRSAGERSNASSF